MQPRRLCPRTLTASEVFGVALAMIPSLIQSPKPLSVEDSQPPAPSAGTPTSPLCFIVTSSSPLGRSPCAASARLAPLPPLACLPPRSVATSSLLSWHAAITPSVHSCLNIASISLPLYSLCVWLTFPECQCYLCIRLASPARRSCIRLWPASLASPLALAHLAGTQRELYLQIALILPSAR